MMLHGKGGGGGAVPGVCVLPLRHGDDASW